MGWACRHKFLQYAAKSFREAVAVPRKGISPFRQSTCLRCPAHPFRRPFHYLFQHPGKDSALGDNLPMYNLLYPFHTAIHSGACPFPVFKVMPEDACKNLAGHIDNEILKEEESMEMQQIIEQAEQNIRQALEDYGKHTSRTGVLDDVSDRFICRLRAAHPGSVSWSGHRLPAQAC